MAKRKPDLVEEWIRRGVLLAAEMRKHGVVMRMQLTWEPVKTAARKATKNRKR